MVSRSKQGLGRCPRPRLGTARVGTRSRRNKNVGAYRRKGKDMNSQNGPIELVNLVDYQKDAIVSKTLLKSEEGPSRSSPLAKGRNSASTRPPTMPSCRCWMERRRSRSWGLCTQSTRATWRSPERIRCRDRRPVPRSTTDARVKACLPRRDVPKYSGCCPILLAADRLGE